MAEKLGANKKNRTPEYLWRWFRNVSALGAAAWLCCAAGSVNNEKASRDLGSDSCIT